jgi:hypothetical protein
MLNNSDKEKVLLLVLMLWLYWVQTKRMPTGLIIARLIKSIDIFVTTLSKQYRSTKKDGKTRHMSNSTLFLSYVSDGLVLIGRKLTDIHISIFLKKNWLNFLDSFIIVIYFSMRTIRWWDLLCCSRLKSSKKWKNCLEHVAFKVGQALLIAIMNKIIVLCDSIYRLLSAIWMRSKLFL